MDKFLKVKEMADILKVSPQQIRKEIIECKLKSHRIGNTYRTTETEFKEYIDSLSTFTENVPMGR